MDGAHLDDLLVDGLDEIVGVGQHVDDLLPALLPLLLAARRLLLLLGGGQGALPLQLVRLEPGLHHGLHYAFVLFLDLKKYLGQVAVLLLQLLLALPLLHLFVGLKLFFEGRSQETLDFGVQAAGEDALVTVGLDLVQLGIELAVQLGSLLGVGLKVSDAADKGLLGEGEPGLLVVGQGGGYFVQLFLHILDAGVEIADRKRILLLRYLDALGHPLYV